jgi:hypothetical protein
MTRVCEWKNASRRSTKSAPREVNHLSTAEAFHLIEEVAAMHVPLLALTGGDPLTRPDLFPIIEFASSRCAASPCRVLAVFLYLIKDLLGQHRVCKRQTIQKRIGRFTRSRLEEKLMAAAYARAALGFNHSDVPL